MNLTYRELLSENRNFRLLLGGQVVAELGNWFNFIAVLGLVRTVSHASPEAAGVLFLCRVLPFALFSPIAGTFVDRFSRRQVMIWADLIRAVLVLSFLLITSNENLWIAYLGTIFISGLGAFFEGAKNASTPNMTGKEGLLAGTALIFSSRFLLMAIGSALGGFAAAIFGYQFAFIINSITFIISAICVWNIPEEATRDSETANRMADKTAQQSFINELKEGFRYTTQNHFALTILIMNIIWATGGGAIQVVFERMGGVHFADKEQLNPDLAVGVLWFASGLGLFLGMMIAHRTEAILEKRKSHISFIGWTLIIHGVLFSIGGLMPSLWLLAIFCFVSRALIGVEYAVQETMFQRSLPDYIRGRISTLDRGAEMTVFSLSSYFASLAMYGISPQILTVISGILAGSAGIIWFLRAKKIEFLKEKVNEVKAELEVSERIHHTT